MRLVDANVGCSLVWALAVPRNPWIPLAEPLSIRRTPVEKHCHTVLITPMTRLPGDDVLSCVSPFHQPKVSASRRQEWQADQGLKWHRATVDSARPACVHASVVRHVSPCITRMWLRPLDCDVDVASQCLLTLLTSTKHRPINHQPINEFI